MTDGPDVPGALRLTILATDGADDAYRDGAEDAVFASIRDAADRRAGSDDLASRATDWPTRYHLSRQRADLLRPLAITPAHRILDVGAGSGALTRYLGETGATVVALEPTLARARACALRCQDLPNVEVVAGPLDAYGPAEGFDLIVCVGVLEYAAGDEARLQAFLTGLVRLLRADGVLLVAIENQIGLKYLLGYAEDHLGGPWTGLEDYAGQQRVRTFGRASLRRRLSDAGFPAQRWLFPYPDYKLPSTILDEQVFAARDAEETVDKIVRWPTGSAASEPARLCDDRRAHRVLLREGLGADVANSFLVLAARHGESLARLLPGGFLAQHTGWDRQSRWRGRTRFERDGDTVIVRRGSDAETRTDGWLTRFAGAPRAFVPGPTVEQLALAACAAGADRLAEVLGEWQRHLRALERPAPSPGGTGPFTRAERAVLPREYFDLVLSNFVRDSEGRLHYIDDEWRADDPVDADLAVGRALFWFANDLVTRGVRHPFGAAATVLQIADTLAGLCGRAPVSAPQLLPAEAAFQSVVTGRTVDEWIGVLERLAATSQADLPVPTALPFTSLAEAARDAVRLRDEAHRLAGEVESARAAHERALEDAAAHEATVRAELRTAQRDLAHARSELARAREDLDRTGDRLADSQARLREAVETASHLTARLDARETEAAAQRETIARLVARLEADARRHDTARAGAEAVERRLDAALARLASSAHAEDRSARERASLLARLREEAGAREAAQAEAVDLRQRVRDAEHQPARRLVGVLTHLGTAAAMGRHAGLRRRLMRLALSPALGRRARVRARQVLASGLFDPEHYRRQAGLDLPPGALAFHFEIWGRYQGLTPCPLFDTRHYLAENPDVRDADENPLVHYAVHGAWEGRNPSTLFESAFYLEQHPELREAREVPLRHFLRHGAARGSRPSPLFDTAWYLRTYPGVVASGVNPLVHYLEIGWKEGFDPNPFFDTSDYLARYPDVAASGLNPLEHYVRHGRAERRVPGPRFDPACYLASRPDVARAGVDPLWHLLRHGLIESGADPGHAVAVRHPDLHLHLQSPLGPLRIKQGQPFRVSGWIRCDTQPLAAVIVQVLGASRFAFDLPLASDEPASHPRHFEANLSLDGEGDTQVLLAVRAADGSTRELAALPVVTVTGDVFCEAMRGHLPTTRRFSVLYVDGMGRHFQSPRYRIDNMREALARAGMASAATDVAGLFDDISQLRHHDVLVVFRAGWDWRLDAIARRAEAWHIPVVFDVDDYVFEPAIADADHIAGIRDWAPDQVAEYRRGVDAFRTTLERCQYFTGSSEFLVERARELGRTAFLLNNHLNERLVALGATARAIARGDETLDIVYISGTRTHQRDFATIVPALADLLRARPRVRLRVVGYLNLAEYAPLQPYAGRIREEGFLAWDEIPGVVGGSHITIAPLEMGNPFCEAKSELKYFEGAAFGMAVVATPTDPFARAIQDGETGFLCRTVDEWRDRLFALVDDPALRTRLAEAGAADALARFGPAHAAAQAAAVYRAVIEDARRRRGVAAEALAINWVMLDPFAGSGGHNDIFIAANAMVDRGHAVTLFFGQREAEGDSRAIRAYIERHFGYEARFEIALGYDAITSCDALIATHYTTAEVVHRLGDRTHLPAYFVQDYEPYFSPVSAEYFAAEQTYRSGLHCITLGPWLKGMVARHGAAVDDIPFWVDPRFYRPAEAPARRPRPRVLYFARPHMARRCYDLGLAALSRLARLAPDAEICLFGAAEFPGSIDFPYTPLGILSPDALGALYRSSDVGLAFSTTNPSLVTFEMMACGLPLVDLDVFDSRERHGGYPARLVEPSPQAIAAEVARLLANPNELEALRQASIAFTRGMPTPDQALAGVSRIVEREVRRVTTAPAPLPASML